MSIPSVNLRIEKGMDFEATFNVEAADGSAFSLINYSALAKIRKHPTAGTAKTFTTSIVSSTGEITISLGSTATSGLTAGRNYYDVVITSSTTGKKTKVFEGNAIVIDTVSV